MGMRLLCDIRALGMDAARRWGWHAHLPSDEHSVAMVVIAGHCGEEQPQV